jgi:hypothetical protein
MSGFLELGGGRIKSIQRGTITVGPTGGGSSISSATATITAVDTAKSIISFLGVTAGSGGGGGDARVELTNGTTVTAKCQSYGVVTTVIVGYQVVEYY